ncbi:MAG: hypothetical protein ACRDK5_04735 [Solirubrobacterales bacterium]
MRKYLVGMIAGLVGAVALSSAASAEVTSLSIGSQWTPAKQDKKKRGPAKSYFETNEAHAGDLLGQPGCLGGDDPACYAYPPAVQSLITFPKDVAIDPGNLPDCSLGSLIGKSTAAARAACPRSIVGGGNSVGKNLEGQTLNGVVTAFNGAPTGGNPSLYLHLDIAGVATKPILNGVVRGNTLLLQTRPVAGIVSEHFDTTLNPVITRKKENKKTGKVKKTFLISIRCSKSRTWTTTETITYQNEKTLTDGVSQKCKQKKKRGPTVRSLAGRG